MTQTEVLKLALEALTPWASEDANHTEQYAAYHALRKALAQPDPVPYWHSEFLKHNTTSDHCMMENAQGELERIRLVQTGVGIGKPEQEPVAHVVIVGDMVSVSTGSNGLKELHKLGDGAPLYTTPPQPEQEPVAWRNAALRVGEDLCSVGPFGYYDMTAEQWLDWALSVVTVHTPPPQRTWVGLTDEEFKQIMLAIYNIDLNVPGHSSDDYLLWNAIEAKLKEKNT